MGFFYGFINSNEIDNWINENVVTLRETYFGIFVKGFGSGKGTYVSAFVRRYVKLFFCKLSNREGC